jgi:Holliday junction DNA helicase RuvA
MIAYIEGRLLHVSGDGCTVVTQGGVGYGILVSAHTAEALPAVGEQVSLYTSHVIREDAQTLYGFETLEERRTFDMLLTITKVGPRTALSILAQYRPSDLRRIVLEQDVKALERISGIGKKSAQQIFLELKFKLKTEGESGALPLPQAAIQRDVLDGLGNLGYAEEECIGIVREILHQTPDLDVSGALRAALKALAKGKPGAEKG